MTNSPLGTTGTQSGTSQPGNHRESHQSQPTTVSEKEQATDHCVLSLVTKYKGMTTHLLSKREPYFCENTVRCPFEQGKGREIDFAMMSLLENSAEEFRPNPPKRTAQSLTRFKRKFSQTEKHKAPNYLHTHTNCCQETSHSEGCVCGVCVRQSSLD